MSVLIIVNVWTVKNQDVTEKLKALTFYKAVKVQKSKTNVLIAKYTVIGC